MTTSTAQKKRPNQRARIRLAAVELLQQRPEGLTYTELVQAMRQLHPDRNLKSLSNDVVNLDRHFPSKVYKPAKGVYRHNRFKDSAEAQAAEPKPPVVGRAARIAEEKFYPLFAAWLTNDLEEVTVAIPLGGNAFRDRWDAGCARQERESPERRDQGPDEHRFGRDQGRHRKPPDRLRPGLRPYALLP